jgi:hypothetical protein
MTFICSECRKQGNCRNRWRLARESVLALVDGREVTCDEFHPTWQARLAA